MYKPARIIQRSLKATVLVCALAVCTFLSGCHEEPENPEDVTAVFQNIATYAGDNDSGRSMLQYRQINDSPLVTLTLQVGLFHFF